MNTLNFEVLVNDGVGRHRDMRLPDGSPVVSSPIASTLLTGERDAVLVDAPFTRAQIDRVIAWVEQSGKHLTHIYATHGHGDHWFGADRVIRHFPGVTAYATPGTIAMMHDQATTGRAEKWDNDFPGLIPDSPVVFSPIGPDGFELEGYGLHPVEVGHTDTDDTTVLHVPSIDLVVAGDVVYNGVHQYLLETGDGGFERWLEAIDTVESLDPRAIVAGHKDRTLPDEPAVKILDQTRDYLLDAHGLLAQRPSPREFFDQMLALYPTRLNPGPLWYGALALLS
jgi:glyoxylase-like metal-dependent hydrolase (beta-lactamase superfamily II)